MSGAHNDIDQLRRRLDTLTRAATRIRTHAADLHSLAYEPHVGDTEKVRGGGTDHAPRAGDPRARRHWQRIINEVASIEAELVGLDRVMVAIFTARAERPEPSRGSTISAAEHDWRLKKQQERNDANPRLEPQPSHPGKRR